MISAIILAAGTSKRMGQQKLLMRWGDSTVLEQVISVFTRARIEDILVVTGADRGQIEELVSRAGYPVRSTFNQAHENGEMLSSIQCGLRNLAEINSNAALIGLGDQPQIEEGTVRLVCDEFQKTGNPLVVPSFQMRRGHPWLIGRNLWHELLNVIPPLTPRDFLSAHFKQIRHVDSLSHSILDDLDTPEDYQAARP